MPRFYHGGQYTPPPELRHLPISAMQSHMYPRHAAEFRRALQEQLDGPPPPDVYLPGRMAQQRFKDGGSGGPPTEYGASGRSAVEAMLQRGQRSRELYNAAGVPVAVMTPTEVADELGATAAPFDFDPEVYEEPVPRNVLPRGRMQVTVRELQQLVAEEESRALRSRVAVSTKLDRAVAQVQAQAAALEHLAETDEVLPWWQR